MVASWDASVSRSSVPIAGRTFVLVAVPSLTTRTAADYTPAAPLARVDAAAKAHIRGPNEPVDDGPSPIDGDGAVTTTNPFRPAF
jgi:hypothetical protein